jgi:hypothetical protein
MVRARRDYLPGGYIWHLSHRCHERESLRKLACGAGWSTAFSSAAAFVSPGIRSHHLVLYAFTVFMACEPGRTAGEIA